jgi:ribokinase
MTIYSPELPQRGQTVLGDAIDIGPGGKGANQAIAAGRLGADATFVVKIGTDRFGTEARELLRTEGLDSRGILSADTHTGIALILVDRHAENMISVAPGANGALTSSDLDGIPGLFEGASHLLCQLECPPTLFAGAARRARSSGIATVLNPAPATNLPENIYQLVDVLTPNESELATLTGMELSTDRDIESAARLLLSYGAGCIVATLGHRGVAWITRETCRWLPAYSVTALDSTGAGDAFSGALVSALASNQPMEQAIDLGMRAGAFCTTRRGVVAGLPSLAQLDSEIPSTRSQEIR